MPRSKTGHINAGRINKSPRLSRIIEILKEAGHPLSAQEVAVQAYDYQKSGKVMLNISTNIGEMRSEENQNEGYIISEAHKWVVKKNEEKRHKNTFFIDPDGPIDLWHDGRPRYWLIAAPGWRPTWKIDEEGILIYCGNQELGVRIRQPIIESKDLKPENRSCLNPHCSRPLADQLGPPFCPGEVCKREYFASLLLLMPLP
jgi:hypothetical protein